MQVFFAVTSLELFVLLIRNSISGASKVRALSLCCLSYYLKHIGLVGFFVTLGVGFVFSFFFLLTLSLRHCMRPSSQTSDL